ncbi:MAG: Tim44/TimA family putative adaptor protein [Hyphomicrobiales bacterium]
MNLDIYSIIAIIICIVVFFQLRSVLGKRTGSERPPFDPYTSKEESKLEKGDADNVVAMPKRNGAKGAVLNPHLEEDDSVTAVIDRLAETGTALNDGLRKIVDVDSNFDPDGFLDGARSAYEYIVTAFAAGDRNTLEGLLSSDVFEGFEGAIKDREERKETIDFSFVGINKSSIVSADLIGSMARVQVDFRSELIQAIMDEEGRIVDGDPNAINEVTDIWTFERDTAIKDPNWRLVATETPD